MNTTPALTQLDTENDLRAHLTRTSSTALLDAHGLPAIAYLVPTPQPGTTLRYLTPHGPRSWTPAYPVHALNTDTGVGGQRRVDDEALDILDDWLEASLGHHYADEIGLPPLDAAWVVGALRGRGLLTAYCPH